MNIHASFNRRQLLNLMALILLSPILRLIPGSSAMLAGRAAWISPLAAAPFLLLYLRLLCRLFSARQEGEGLPELILRILGKPLGRPVLLLFAAWLLLYGGFTLRAGADRLIVTSYPRSGSAIFVVCLGAASLWAALGSARSLVRIARMVLPFLGLVLAVIFFFSLQEIHAANLLPLTFYDAFPAVQGALPLLDVLSLGLYLGGFFLSSVPRQPEAEAALRRWLGWMLLLLLLLSLTVMGVFGASLSVRLSQAFFALVRNLVFFRSLERTEALVVTFWLFPDFLLVSAALYAAQYSLRLALGRGPRCEAASRLDLAQGRWLILPCGGAVILSGLLIAPETAALSFWSERLIPGINLVFAFVLLPLLYVLGRQKRRL